VLQRIGTFRRNNNYNDRNLLLWTISSASILSRQRAANTVCTYFYYGDGYFCCKTRTRFTTAETLLVDTSSASIPFPGNVAANTYLTSATGNNNRITSSSLTSAIDISASLCWSGFFNNFRNCNNRNQANRRNYRRQQNRPSERSDAQEGICITGQHNRVLTD